jgi:hypothetical protein
MIMSRLLNPLVESMKMAEVECRLSERKQAFRFIAGKHKN